MGRKVTIGFGGNMGCRLPPETLTTFAHLSTTTHI